MNKFLLYVTLILSLLLPSMHAIASPMVDRMSDIEVSEYAIQMSTVIENIQDRQLCLSNDVTCVRAVFARHGVSYDDKEAVKKRLYIMMGTIH